MHSRLRRIFAAVCILAASVLVQPGLCEAAGAGADFVYKDGTSNKKLVVTDEQMLFTDEQKNDMINIASGVLKYANVYVVTSAREDYEALAKELVDDTFGNGSDSTLFMINMNPRMIYIFSEGSIKHTLTQDKANVITDNIYRQASKGAYFECTKKALSQEAILLSGGSIPQPMKYAGDLFLAFAVAILLVYGMTFWLLPKKKSDVIPEIDDAVFAAISAGVVFSLLNTERIYDPPSKGSSGGGGSGGGGSGGGGDSGAGGGHSF